MTNVASRQKPKTLTFLKTGYKLHKRKSQKNRRWALIREIALRLYRVLFLNNF